LHIYFTFRTFETWSRPNIFLVHHCFKEIHQMRRRRHCLTSWGEIRAHHTVPTLGRMVDPTSFLMGLFPYFFGSMDVCLPKTIQWILGKVEEEHEIHKRDLQTASIGGETLLSCPWLPLWLHRPHLLNHSTMMNRE
jgi:hypothetical protein